MRTSLLALTLLVATGCPSGADKVGLDDSNTPGEDCDDPATWYADADEDGYGDPIQAQVACVCPEGWTDDDGDCDDADASVHPGSSEVPYDGIDQDCDPATLDDDLDGDGYDAQGTLVADCDDTDPTIYPGAPEVCDDGIVNDCLHDAATAQAVCGLFGEESAEVADLTLTDVHEDDGAGWAVSGGGDIDGDGLDDLLVGAPYNHGGGWESGAVYLVVGLRDPAAYTPLSLDDADLTLVGETALDEAGVAVALVRDVDGDGLDDLLLGASSATGDQSSAGAAYLVYGSPALVGAGEQSLSAASLKLSGRRRYDQAGSAVAGAGDINGDGLGDLVVGARGDASNGTSSGAAFLILGAADLGLEPERSLDEADLELLGVEADDMAGWRVTGGQDLDGDGLDDLVASAPGALGSCGVAYVVLGSEGVAAPGTLSLDDADWSMRGLDPGEGMGIGTALVDDVDGDGFADVLLGAPGGDGIAETAGLVYLVLGSAGMTGDWLTTNADSRLLGERPYDNAGLAVADAGDVDADGEHDLLVGAPLFDLDEWSQGAAYLVPGSTDLRGGATYMLPYAPLTLFGIDQGDDLGYALAGAGDFDGDGIDDILVGAYGHDADAEGGEAYLLLGGTY